MSSDYSATKDTEDTAPKDSCPDKPCGCEGLKQSVADSLCQAATALEQTASTHDGGSGLAEVEQHAARWLHHSADYVRQFSYEHEEANLRKHISHNPGRSMVIAGAAGLVLGILLRKI
ncbi:hypothetical protein [Pelovirga terrestris]|uniref:DUF883 domain-containing protein n=1 Tax=Pelovirga terrestris TaxID=2771352 RepID=A0A8J6QLJ2_9BACT|nr:hypothetical protein [Pelovirga terrestris]MBD1400579.1 hypothetical protein [Pelovirga terrestris]